MSHGRHKVFAKQPDGNAAIINAVLNAQNFARLVKSSWKIRVLKYLYNRFM